MANITVLAWHRAEERAEAFPIVARGPNQPIRGDLAARPRPTIAPPEEIAHAVAQTFTRIHP